MSRSIEPPGWCAVQPEPDLPFAWLNNEWLLDLVVAVERSACLCLTACLMLIGLSTSLHFIVLVRVCR